MALSNDSSSQALLDKLDELLVDCTPQEVENAYGVDYTVGLDELKKACANHMKKVESAVTERACQLLVGSQTSRTSAEPFRILSIGCGDGTFDAQILSAMMSRHPDVKIHYTGLDIDKETCQKATETLSLLKTNNKVDIKMLTMEFEDIDSVKAEISPCDLVLAVHVLYYMKDIKKALTDVQMLTKTNGCMFILLTTPGSPKTQLFRRFWLHEHRFPMKFSDAAIDNLDTLQLGIKYETEIVDGELDFTESFRDGFQKPHQKFLLDFMTHAKMGRYPPAISQLCVEYLASAAIGKPKQYIIPFSVAFIVCKNQGIGNLCPVPQ